MYYLLVASLPPLPAHFETGPLPISRERLVTRLRLLSPEDAAQMAAAMELIRWGRQFEESDDAAVARRCNLLMQKLVNPILREVMNNIFGGREIVAALRRRLRGWGPPVVALGPWAGPIRRNFSRPDFGLGGLFPWISLVDQYLREGALGKIYSQMLETQWAYLKRQSERHYFDFEAVVLYVARWDVVYRRQAFQAERGRERFEALLKEVLGDYATIPA